MYKRHKELMQWTFRKTRINETMHTNKKRSHFFPRGSIVSVYLGENIGFEKGGTRPAVIVSNDMNNRASGNVVIIPLTDESNKPKRLLPSQYRLFKSNYKLSLNSIVQCEDIRVVSKARLGNVIDFVNKEDMKNINKRIKTMLAL